MLVGIDGLACHRGGRMVFRDLDFTAPSGSAALVRGPNGIGKSTLLRVLAGLIPAAAGRVLLDGQPAGPAALQERVAYAGHLDAVKPALTVAQNLATWAGIFDGGGTDRALAFLGLDHIADRPAAQCSAGQRRRLGLARLMVVDRPLWLLDEPTVSLDAASAGLVAGLVRDHCAAGGTALIATHIDLDLPPGPVLEMVPPAVPPLAPPSASPAAAPTPAGDAFLDGDWR